MANESKIETELNGITDLVTQRVLKSIFKYALKDIRFGRAIAGKAAMNISGGFFTGTTPSVANQEFAIAHTFGTAPYLLQQVLPLDQIGASLVRLMVSKAADSHNVYLKSPDTSQPIVVWLEG